MTVAFWCVLIAIFLPLICSVIAKVSSGKFRPGHNHDPRDFLERLEGLQRRAHAAQLNGFEVLPGFAAAVIIAHIAGKAQLVTIDVLAVLGRSCLFLLHARAGRGGIVGGSQSLTKQLYSVGVLWLATVV